MPTPSCASSLAVKAGEQVALVCDAHSEMSMVYALPGVTESLGRRIHHPGDADAQHLA